MARHFSGSWAAALTTAGYPTAIQQYDTSLAERVQNARCLAAGGMSRPAIADALGVGVAGVYRYLSAGACDSCGGRSSRAARYASRAPARRFARRFQGP